MIHISREGRKKERGGGEGDEGERERKRREEGFTYF